MLKAIPAHLYSLGPLELVGDGPLLLEGEHVLSSVPGYCEMDVTAPVPAVLGLPPQPVTLSAQPSGGPGQSSLQAPVAVCPPRPGPSEYDEGAPQADWEAQVEAEEDTRVVRDRQVVVPDWADLETPPVPEVPPLPVPLAPAPLMRRW